MTYTKIVERYALFFDRPEVRLRFLNKTLARQNEREKQLHRSLRRLAFIENTGLYKWLLQLGLYRLIFEEVQGFLPSIPEERRALLRQINAPVSARIFFQLYKVRYLFYGAGIGVAAVGLFGLYLLVSWSARGVNTWIAQHYRTPNQQSAGSPGTVLANPARYLPDYKPEKVWLVEKKENYERYSNSARILTDYEVDNHPRQYYIASRGAEVPGKAVYHEPVGIIYHTSENEMVEFKPGNNDSIQAKTRGLLGYVREKRAYNYLIDRFGQIYRIVRDNQAAHHAGHSVWADQKNLYIGLNESFIGVCFESSMQQATTPDEQLTEAQLISGRALTAVLRSRYNIDEANCVTHGLVSVNPETMQIAPHYDLVRNFPFEAVGVSDKYKVPPVSVSEFGFGWDDKLLEKIGGPLWPGVAAAEEEFKRRAAALGLDARELRRQKRDSYLKQYDLGRRLREGGQAQAE
ncbi:MAG TPA: peptidoglycan recognition family protein [Blastocatellia bacterium]|nr:peptidoglycan recognition family protein [Blastocatellia bacterium]